MGEREDLARAIAALEGQRAVLGDKLTDQALAPLRGKLAGLIGDSVPAPPATAGPEAERRRVTALFADVVGSTALAERMDAEEWRALMNMAFARMSPAVERYGGTIARLMGDAILAFFGAPVAHEDDPARGARAALDLLAEARAFGDEIRRERGIEFTVRVGLNTGPVVVGDVGSAQFAEYTAMGDAVNVAARMQAAAEAGAALVGEETYRATSSLFEFEDRGLVAVKGKSAKIHVYRLLGERRAAGRTRAASARAGERGGAAEDVFVGREAELAAVTDALKGLGRGGGGLLVVLADAGLGKSRLIDEARRQITGAIRWLEARTLSFSRPAYWLVSNLVREWAGIADDDTEPAALAKLDAAVQALLPDEREEVMPYLASLLALTVPGELSERVRYLDAEAMKGQLYRTVRRLVDALARERPTVLLFDDLHWADEASAHLAEHLLPLATEVPLLLVALSRPDPDSPARQLLRAGHREGLERIVELPLAPLTGDETALLTRARLGTDELPAEVRALIVRRAEGNPFYVEELIRTLTSSRSLARAADGGWRLTAPVDAVAIPDTVQGLIVARIDRLDADLKRVLRTASVIGRNFLVRLLEAVETADPTLERELEALQGAELIELRPRISEIEFGFRHALAHEATYESILVQKRRELHGLVGTVIERIFADRLDEFASLLAYHFAHAEGWERAQHYLMRAADLAGSLAADADALGLYQQAMTAYGRAFGDRWDPVQRASLERKTAEAHFRRGQTGLALSAYERALGPLGISLPSTRWSVRRAILGEIAAYARRRIGPRRRAPPSAEEFARGDEASKSFGGLIWADVFGDPERVILDGLRLINIGERIQRPEGVALGLSALGFGFDFIGRRRPGTALTMRAWRIAEPLEDQGLVAVVMQNVEVHNYIWGDFEASHEWGLRSAERARAVGDLQVWATSSMFVAYIHDDRGEFDAALAIADDVVREGEAAGQAFITILGAHPRARVLRRSGRLDEALELRHRSVKLAETIENPIFRVENQGELARLLILLGRFEEAAVALETSEQLALRYRIRSGPTMSLRLGQAELALHEVERSSRRDRGRALRAARERVDAATAMARTFRAATTEAWRLRGRWEWLAGRPGPARSWWERSIAEAARTGFRYDGAVTAREMGERLDEPDRVARAEAALRDLQVVIAEPPEG